MPLPQVCLGFRTDKLLSPFRDLAWRPPPSPTSPSGVSGFLPEVLCVLCGVIIDFGDKVFSARLTSSRPGDIFEHFLHPGHLEQTSHSLLEQAVE